MQPLSFPALRSFFNPRSVAVVGVSRAPASIGYRLLQTLLQGKFAGPVYPVNPCAESIQGLRVYPSVREIPHAVDLAVIAVPAAAVAGVLDDCAARGIGAVVIISAGFAESGPEGERRQQQVLDKVRAHGMRMIGPNCLGVLARRANLNATFVPVFPPPGGIAMSSDSGALTYILLAAAQRMGLGIASCVSVGNRADVSSNDLLEYWEDDPETKLILLYLESFGNPRRFARIARRVSQHKPIVAVKAGRTSAGQRAAQSHTAALAVNEAAVDALFHQTGIIRAETLEDMLALAAALGNQPLPGGRRVGVLTNAGGPAILCADACEAGGLVLPEFSPQLRATLASFLPTVAGVKNPVDMIAAAGPELYRRAIAAVLASGEVDALIVMYVAADPRVRESMHRAIADSMAEARRNSRAASVTVLACLMPELQDQTLMVSATERVPCFAFPEGAARVLSKMAALARWRARPAGSIPIFADVDVPRAQDLCAEALTARGPGWLTTEETRAVLTAMGLPLQPGGVARSAEEARRLARVLGFPVAVKLASHQILHKTEIGGVHLNLADEDAVVRAFQRIHERLARDGRLEAMEGVLVQPMVSDGTEVMVGVTQDPLFGPLIAFGLGGIHVEILGDVRFRVTPLTDRDAAEMVRSIHGYRLFEGYRGHPPADIAALEEVLLRISSLVEHVPQVSELDLNPIFALVPGLGCRIVDARLRVNQVRKEE